MSYGSTVTLQKPFGEVVPAVRDALAAQGFGVLTEIDVKATMKAKLGEDLAPYLILGACNPPLALRALEIDPTLGLLLPCNVVVRQTDEGTVVDIIDPMTLVTVSDNPDLRPVADEAAARLRAALDALQAAR
jgi:uncharacterized protein (DUF302 family)